ncbi:aspartyl-tRNA(Asn)/glutamyl-tRNA(Gln) amidotransferase subunit A [Antricoccus suffuscus]|uniref:Aspartyl-tRNA(Asn)/glutamyl-tRNA(Gln) amidotransferase subunit A n=1 Tax=Antricoccus suffuscus TaxID=1629062 RepID=A0A2T0ZZ26_9ACTN|nr:amidase [Antricoccus suffuscus]PRZ41601.1 aspartyl-tRNA(Asn)/glutamyl-tRNA(Gln) amidotransferase subunit A [Antricoccus suffuscus]
MHPYELTLTEAAEKIGSKELSPVELAESVLGRIEAVDGRVGAFAAVTADRAMADAKRAADDIAAGNYRGALHGVTVGVKDLVDTAGIATTSSSKTRADNVPNADAAVVERLSGAGAVLVGKTHTHEFAYGVITPTTRNPWNLDHIPGGSSGGSAAAIASQMCHGAIGTDTGGSIRIPSAACGTVGLKPTYGRVSRRGITSLSWALDHVGPITRTVHDAALMMNVLAGYDRADPGTVDEPVPDFTAGLDSGVKGMVFGLPTNYFFDNIDLEVESAVRAAVDVLTGLGAQVREIELPMTETYMSVEFGILVPEASAYHQKLLREKADLYTDDVRVFLDAGELMLATDYIKALRVRTLIQDGWRDMFEGLDAVLAPTLPSTAARVGQDTFNWGVEEPVINAYVRTSAPGNLTGLPGLSVPCGLSNDGLPIGLQILGKPFAEPTVLRIGAAYEAANPSAGKVPTLG